MTTPEDAITHDFIIEAREILERLGEQLVALENAPDDSEQLNAVFRGFHTLKGGAGFLSVQPMVELCHAAEEALGLARSGKLALQAPHFDAAQQSLDWLQTMLDALAQGDRPPSAPETLIAAFQQPAAVMSSPVTATHSAESAASDTINDDEFEALLDQLQAEKKSPEIKVVDASTKPPQPIIPTSNNPPTPQPQSSKSASKSTEPETSIRVDTRRLDAIVNLTGELVLARNRLKTLRLQLKHEELDRAVTTLDSATSRLQSAVMRTRMQPVGKVFSRFPKLTRDVARSLNKEVELELTGADTELDRNLVEALAAIDHGIEMPDLRQAQGKERSGRVRLSAQQEGDHVSIEIHDDGAGIDPERLRSKAREKGLLSADAAARLGSEECLHLVFLPGLSTKQEISNISGRGVGMDVVQSRIRELGGQISIHSELGRGSRFIIRVPLTLAILPTLLIQAAEDIYALPLARVVEVLHASHSALACLDGCTVLDRNPHTLPLVDMRQWLGLEPAPAALLTVVVLQAAQTRFGLVVDQVRGREEVVIKPLPLRLRGLSGYAGATLIGDGRMALILDVDSLRNRSLAIGFG